MFFPDVFPRHSITITLKASFLALSDSCSVRLFTFDSQASHGNDACKDGLASHNGLRTILASSSKMLQSL